MDNFNQGTPGNPYSSPTNPPTGGGNGGSNAAIVAPGIALVVIGSIGLLASIYGVINALIGTVVVDPNAPEWAQEMMKNSVGPFAAVIQGLFVIVNAVIIFGGICMIRVQNWTVALISAILSIINIGSCCCLLGLPIGIWAIAILSLQDTKRKMN